MQNREKQIEEMASIIYRSGLSFKHQAERLYEAGYRKQSEGEWIVARTERSWNNAEYPIERSCSVCGMRRNIETQEAWNFCPNCGASMKGGAE